MIPESYGGTSLSPRAHKDSADEALTSDTEECKGTPTEEGEIHTSSPLSDEKATQTFAPLSKIPFIGYFKNIVKFDNFGLQKIGTEEILIIATAAFLFFSKDGDKECAILLLLLLLLS